MLINDIFTNLRIDNREVNFFPVLLVRAVDNDINIWYRNKSDNISKHYYNDIDYKKIYDNIHNPNEFSINVLEMYIENLIDNNEILDSHLYNNFMENKKHFINNTLVETKYYYRRLKEDEIKYKIKNNHLYIPKLKDCKMIHVDSEYKTYLKPHLVINNLFQFRKGLKHKIINKILL